MTWASHYLSRILSPQLFLHKASLINIRFSFTCQWHCLTYPSCFQVEMDTRRDVPTYTVGPGRYMVSSEKLESCTFFASLLPPAHFHHEAGLPSSLPFDCPALWLTIEIHLQACSGTHLLQPPARAQLHLPGMPSHLLLILFQFAMRAPHFPTIAQASQTVERGHVTM